MWLTLTLRNAPSTRRTIHVLKGELSDLDMRGSYMGDEGVTTLSKIFAAGLCPTLTRLNLAQNGCSDRGLRALALSIANNKSKIRLEALDLSRNDIHEVPPSKGREGGG